MNYTSTIISQINIIFEISNSSLTGQWSIVCLTAAVARLQFLRVTSEWPSTRSDREEPWRLLVAIAVLSIILVTAEGDNGSSEKDLIIDDFECILVVATITSNSSPLQQ